MKDDLKKAIRTILLEFQERELPKPFVRETLLPKHHLDIRKAWVLMGMRRSGKTFLAYQQIQLRQAQGFAKNTNLYINFEDDRLSGFEIQDFQSILDVYFELYPQHSNSSDLFFCFDEIQIVDGWEKFIRRLIDTEKMQICVTGSSAKMLSKELATTLGGRAWPIEVWPLSFSEFLYQQGIKNPSEATPKTEAHIRHLASEYLFYGGFPEAVMEPKELHTALLQGYMDAVVLRDIVNRYAISNVDVLQKFLIRMLRQLAAPLSVTKMFDALKSMGLSLGKNSLYEYLQYFEDAYAIFAVPFFSLSEKIRQVNPQKIYAVDQGIITAYSVKTEFEQSARLENAVFIHLRRTFANICYYKTAQHKKEIDFVITTPQGNLMLFQACFNMQDTKTKERETSALYEAFLEFDLHEGWIITQDHEEEIQQKDVCIHCVPFWKWAINSL